MKKGFWTTCLLAGAALAVYILKEEQDSKKEQAEGEIKLIKLEGNNEHPLDSKINETILSFEDKVVECDDEITLDYSIDQLLNEIEQRSLDNNHLAQPDEVFAPVYNSELKNLIEETLQIPVIREENFLPDYDKNIELNNEEVIEVVEESVDHYTGYRAPDIMMGDNPLDVVINLENDYHEYDVPTITLVQHDEPKQETIVIDDTPDTSLDFSNDDTLIRAFEESMSKLSSNNTPESIWNPEDLQLEELKLDDVLEEEETDKLPVHPHEEAKQPLSPEILSIQEIYPALGYRFIDDVYRHYDQYNHELPIGDKCRIRHRIQFRDSNDSLIRFIKIIKEFGYIVSGSSGPETIEITLDFINEESKILSEIYNVANQVSLENGDYKGYELELI